VVLGLALACAVLLIAVPMALVILGRPDDSGGSTGDDGVFTGDTGGGGSGRGGAGPAPTSSAPSAPSAPDKGCGTGLPWRGRGRGGPGRRRR
jgi:hypothetical protein